MPESNEPRELKVRYSKRKSFWMTLGIVAVLILSYAFKARLLDELENRTIDVRFLIRGKRTPSIPIKIVAVDEKSLKEIGQWPWPRAVHAQLVRKLKEAGVKAVFYDVFFPEPERAQDRMLDDLSLVLDSALQGSSKSVRTTREKIMEEIKRFRRGQNGDKELEKAMKETNIVFIPIEPRYQDDGSIPKAESLKFTEAELIADAEAGENPLGDIIPAQSIIVSIPGIANSSRDSGHTRGFPNKDGIYRYYPTVINYQGKLIPHLSLQVVRYMLGDKSPIQVHMGKYTEVAGRKIPILDNGFALINYCGGRDTITTISASDVLNGRISSKELNGCLVEVGATADGLFDLRPTPFTRNSPGVEINANIVENVYTKNFLWPIAEIWKYLLIIFLAFSMWYLVPRLTPFQATIAFFLFLVGFSVSACLLFSYLNIVITVAYPFLALLLTFIILTTYKFRTDVKHARYMKQMFQSVVSPKVVEEILEKGVDLAGEEKELTVMFSDIRGFTTFSEKHTPHEVVDILNEYLTQMTLVLLQTEGTLDKYIGDAIMAFWGAPGNQQDHAYRACSTALGMVDLLHSVLHPKWELEGKEKLDIGIGLNTGKIVVGYVGSQFTKNYTLIGDPVNLGSRLEGTTKEYKVEIIISETTYEYVKMDMLCRELDLIQVKGKTQPIRIYELVDHRLRGAGMKEMKVKAFEEGLAHYRACRFDEAEKRFKNCLELDPKDGPAHIFLDRCKLLAKNPPPSDWNGVFVMKSK